jgi:hypothetical protein
LGRLTLRHIQNLSKRLFELPDEVDEGDTQNSADLAEFQEVQTTSAGFIIADEGLGLSQCVRHIDLPETGFGPKLAEQRTESFLLLSIGREPRPAFFHSARRIEGPRLVYDFYI